MARVSLGRALRHRNYRLFFTGQGTSLIGTWLTRYATGLMAWELSHDAWKVGLVAFFGQAPTSILAPFAGVLVDRWNRYRTIIVTQIFAMVQSALLAAFALTGTMTIWILIGLGAFQAVINAFDMPARQSFLGQMVGDRADLPNAIALNSSMVNSARMVGPMIATVLVAAFGLGWCFAIDALSYLAVIGSLLAMHVTPRPPRPRHADVLAELKQGFQYVLGHPLVKTILFLLATTSILGGAYASMLPVVAPELHGGRWGLGILMGSAGCGALCGALYLASRTTVVGLLRVIRNCVYGTAGGLVLLELAPNVYVAAPILFVVGMSLMVQMASTNTLVQTVVDDDKLGRVMSLYAVAFFGGAPVGALLEGTLAHYVGAVNTMCVAGCAMLVAAILYSRNLPALRERIKPLYRQLGLLPTR
ncbi:MAG TPA: MFS transporter [Kofleriaceae bacterium]|jgi:MFS family permease